MTRQETISEIGKLKPSTFALDGAAIAKNQMSYFIIPIAHEIYSKKTPAKILESFKKLNWKIANNETKRAFSQTDARQMDAIKLYLYDEMLPKIKNISEHFITQRNLLLQRVDLDKDWKFKSYFRGNLEYETEFILDELDLWIVDKNIAFFTIKTKLALSDSSCVSEISSKFNRNMRDFKAMYVDTAANLFSNDSTQGISVLDWLCSMVEIDGQSLLSHTTKKVQDIQNLPEYYPVHNASYNAKMITAIHVDEMEVKGEEIESAFPDELISMNIDGVSVLEEMPYLLGTTSELYPTKTWESNEEFIFEQVGNGQINIWKYWSGVSLHDSLAFFSIGDGTSAIVNSARNSYYFIYILNLYTGYKLRVFEHELIDNEFVSIENIRPLFSDLQRLKNQYMCTELSSLFQPNVVHEAIKSSMKIDDMYGEIKDNIEATLEITSRNTDIIVTVLISIFSIAGMYFNQEMLMTFFNMHQEIAIAIALVIVVAILTAVSYRSHIIRLIKRMRTKIGILERMLD